MAKKTIAAAKAAQKASPAKLATTERWREALKAAKALPPRTCDADGLYNKDHLYRAFRYAHAAGITLSNAELHEACPGVSASKLSSWRRRWQKIAEGTMTPDSSVPKASREFVVPKAKKTAQRKLAEQRRQYDASKAAFAKSVQKAAKAKAAK